MMTIRQLKQALKGLPLDAHVCAANAETIVGKHKSEIGRIFTDRQGNICVVIGALCSEWSEGYPSPVPRTITEAGDQ